MLPDDKNSSNTPPKEHFDLTEEASKRPGSEAATEAARQAESDDSNEETGLGKVDGPDGWVENKVAVSDDD